MSSSKSDTRKVLIIRETIWESIVTDTYTFGCMIGACLVGHMLGIPALEWIAGLMVLGSIVVRSLGTASKNICSIQEARDRLEAWEKSQ